MWRYRGSDLHTSVILSNRAVAYSKLVLELIFGEGFHVEVQASDGIKKRDWYRTRG